MPNYLQHSFEFNIPIFYINIFLRAFEYSIDFMSEFRLEQFKNEIGLKVEPWGTQLVITAVFNLILFFSRNVFGRKYEYSKKNYRKSCSYDKLKMKWV